MTGSERAVDDRSKLAENRFWNCTREEIGAALGCGLIGLGSDEAAQRLRQYGPNRDAAARADSPLRAVLRRLLEPLSLILLVASLLAYQGVQNFAAYSAAKAYVLRLGEALHRELKREGVTVTALCPGMSDTGFATAAQQKITPALKLLMMQPAPVVRAGIRALQAGRISVVPGWANKASVIFMWATPRWLHQAFLSRAMNG